MKMEEQLKTTLVSPGTLTRTRHRKGTAAASYPGRTCPQGSREPPNLALAHRMLSLLAVCLLAGVTAMSACADAEDDGNDAGTDADNGSDTNQAEDDTTGPVPEGDCTFSYVNMIYDGEEIDVWYVFLYPSGSEDIGDDLLGTDILPYGYELTVEGVSPGVYDTILVDEDDYFYLETNVVCSGGEWTLVVTAGDADGQLE